MIYGINPLLLDSFQIIPHSDFFLTIEKCYTKILACTLHIMSLAGSLSSSPARRREPGSGQGGLLVGRGAGFGGQEAQRRQRKPGGQERGAGSQWA